MIKDAQGHDLTGGTREAADHLDQGVRAFALAYGDALASVDTARSSAPGFVMAHLAKAWVLGLANDSLMVQPARDLLASVRGLPMNERERAHAAALAHAVRGHRASATAILDQHLMRYPHDLLGHYAAMLLDAFQGRFHCVHSRCARALPRWSKSQPGYGLMLSFYGFGLEEAGHYPEAEDTSRAAAELEPFGYWPHHAVSHVMEMTGRPADGLAWMAAREPLWSGKANANRVHIWWHKALFHIELGDYRAALDIYDGPVVATQRPLGISLTNATALLWRLETLGIDAGERWRQLSAIWEGHADGQLCLFADIHALMTALRAGNGTETDRLLGAMRTTAGSDAEQAEAYRDIGLPAAAGVAAFHAGDYAGAVEHLFPARYHLWKLGGSHAQRDLIDWTLTEAAVRAGQRDMALSLAYERLGLRPGSAPNRRFLSGAEAIAA
jgi:tetratricopeptide (TPR) repeat protein